MQDSHELDPGIKVHAVGCRVAYLPVLHSLEPGYEGEAVSPTALSRAHAVVSLEHQPSEGGVACSRPVRLGDECRIDAMSGMRERVEWGMLLCT